MSLSSLKIIFTALAALAVSTFSASAQILTFDQAKQRADQGDAFAQAVVALHYQLGWNTQKNPELAVKYAIASAEAGHPLGQFRLGALLRGGEGVPKDEQKGLALQAAAFDGFDQMSGDPYALTSLGVMIFQGKAAWQNIPQDQRRQQAAQLYKRAADLGFAPAQFNYAMCAEAGHGVPQDTVLAEAYIAQSAQAAYPAATLRKNTTVIAPYDVRTSKLSQETMIWKDPHETRELDAWISLGAPTPPKGISAAIRCDYTGWPVRMNNDSEYAFQNHRTVTQYFASEDEDGVIVRPVASSHEPRFIEYPAALVFRLTNSGAASIDLEQLELEVVQWRPIDKVWLDVSALLPEKLALHNYGWGDSGPWQAKIHVFGRESSETIVLQNANGQPTTSFDPTKLFATPSVKEFINDPYYTHGQITVALEAENSESLAGRLSVTYQIPAESAESRGNLHVKVPASFSLPPARNGYRVSFSIDRQLPALAEEEFGISLDSERSGLFTIKATLKTSHGDVSFAKPIHLAYECIRAAPGRPTEVAFVDPGNGGGYSLESYQRALVRQDNDAGKHSQGLRQLEPIVGSLLTPAIAASGRDQDQEHDYLCKMWENDDLSIYANVREGRGESRIGSISVRDRQHRNLIFGTEWIDQGSSRELTVSAAVHPRLNWIAWLAESNEGASLYAAFPKFAEVAFSLPLQTLPKVVGIGLTSESKQLAIRAEDGSEYICDLESALVQSGLHVLETRDLGLGSDDEASSIARLVNANMQKSTQQVNWAVSKTAKLQGSRDVAEQPKLLWLEPHLFAFTAGNKWFECNLLMFQVTEVKGARVEQYAKALIRNKAQAVSNNQSDVILPISEGKTIELSSLVPDEAVLIVEDSKDAALRSWIHVPAVNNGFLNNGILKPRRKSSLAPSFARQLAVSPDARFGLLCDPEGAKFYIVDLEKRSLLANLFIDLSWNSKVIAVTPDGFFAAHDTERVSITDHRRLFPLSQFEAKLNRPDIILERLGAPDDLVAEAKRLRARFLRRSDFKSFEGAALIDIPVVTVKTEVPEKTGDKSLTLDFEASNSTGPLKELRVFNNGALIQTAPLTGKDGQPSREASGDVEIDLASGVNRLQLMAVNEEGFTSAFAEKRVECTAEPDSQRCFIAAVGVSEYNDPRFNLKFAAKDAEDMSKVLAEKAQHRGYQPEVMVVKNAEVDGALVGKLREFLYKAGTDDEVVLFFAGHGLLDKDLEYHFARHDTDFDANENMGITFQELESLVDGIKPLKRTVLFDTCHSGEVEEEDKPQLLAMVGGAAAPDAGSGVQVRGVATRGMKVKELEPKLRHTDFIELESLFPDSRRAKGANILTSSSGSEFSMESDAWQNGLFSYAFLNALNDERTDADGDKAVSFSEAAAAVQDKVKTLSGGQQRPITRGVNREAEVDLANFGPPVAPIPAKEKKSGLWPF